MNKGAVVSALVASAALFGSTLAEAQPAPKPPTPAQPPAAQGEPAPGVPPAPPPPAAKPPAKPAAKPAEPAPAKPGPAGAKGGAPEPPPALQEPAVESEPEEGGEAEAGAPAAQQPSAAPGAPGAVSPSLTQAPMLPGVALGAPLEPREERAAKKAASKPGEQVFAEDWWSHARPVFEIHGYYRLRAELFHKMALGRLDAPNESLFPQTLDYKYGSYGLQTYGPILCSSREGGVGGSVGGFQACQNQTNAGANMRFRLNPELHISDNLRVLSQIDLLDNVMLGSTPQGYAVTPDAGGGYTTVRRNGYNPMGAFDMSQDPPTAGVNGIRNSIAVKRVWAEYSTPVGELRFGRMPSHWGLGILVNSGDGFDDDYQTNIDRIMFVTGIKPLDVYLAGAWDFINEGANSDILGSSRGQAYDLGQLDDVTQYMLSLVRRQTPALVDQALSQGKVVANGGVYALYRKQLLANDAAGNAQAGAWVPNATPLTLASTDNTAYVRRNARLWYPDLWFQLLYRKFRFEAEGVAILGSLENTQNNGNNGAESPNGWKVRQFGFATETEFRAVEDKLKLLFMFGWASGDPNAGATTTGALTPSNGNWDIPPATMDGAQQELGSGALRTFRFHPNYRVDLILNRNILTRVQGSYYLRPSVQYDFMRNPQGQRLGGGVAAIWTRASEFVQTPGHKRDLGIELDGKLYFQSKDGALNDQLGIMGGFYTQLEYGVLFPMGGLGYQPGQTTELQNQWGSGTTSTKAAQVLRWYLGVLF